LVLSWFQAQAAIADTSGVVESANAKRLNLELRERHAFPVGYQHGIVGQVRIRVRGGPLVDTLVGAYLIFGNDQLLLGETRIVAAGAYAIPFDAATLIAKVPPGASMPFCHVSIRLTPPTR
jgi:hypothetical protein